MCNKLKPPYKGQAFPHEDQKHSIQVKSTICTCNANGNATQQQLKLMTKAT